MNLRNILGTAVALSVAIAVSLPGTASATGTQPSVYPTLKKAIDNASLYVPSRNGIVHFHNGEAVKRETLKDAHGDVLSGTVGTYIGDIFPNPSKRHVWHSPDAVIVVGSSGTFSGNSEFTDVIAVRYVHGKIIRAGHYHLFGSQVQNVEFTGRSVKVTYLTPGENDAYCCPTVHTQITLRYDGGPNLKVVPTK